MFFCVFFQALVQDETCFFCLTKFMIDVIFVVGLVFKPTYYDGGAFLECFKGFNIKFQSFGGQTVKDRIKTWYQQKWVNLW